MFTLIPSLFEITKITFAQAAAGTDNLDDVEKLFNLEAAKISPLLGCFDDYEFNHINYCVNFALRELGIDCDPLLIMDLFHRPLKSYKDKLLPFNEETARSASLPADEPDRNTLVLASDSININSYYKYNQLRNDFADCPNIRDAME